MKIIFVLAGEDNLASAGVRIRYNRILPNLARMGHEAKIVLITELTSADRLSGDVFIFCKCYDARTIVLADMLRRSGAHVGVDLFDDYFSQRTNPRFVHLRQWLASIVPNLTFAICSTPMMLRLIETLMPDLPGHIINDPFEAVDQDMISQAVERNIERAVRTRVADVAWFGMGDNPHFSVGLQDLSSCFETLRSLRLHGFAPRLSILTNRRALTPGNLELIARSGISYQLKEWTEPLEKELIQNSLFSFLPVNAQAFSVAKSLNRAVTALTGGSQVLSEGYPLYSELRPFIYREVETLLTDVLAGRPLLRQDTVSDLVKMLRTKADPAHETAGFVDFLERLEHPQVNEPSTYAVIHGRKTSPAIHKQVQKLQHLSVASPFQAANLAFDVRFSKDPATQTYGLLLTQRAIKQLNESLRSKLIGPEVIEKQNFWFLPASAFSPYLASTLFAKGPRYLSINISEYASVMREISNLVTALFSINYIVVSELESPCWPGVVSPASEGTASTDISSGRVA